LVVGMCDVDFGVKVMLKVVKVDDLDVLIRLLVGFLVVCELVVV